MNLNSVEKLYIACDHFKLNMPNIAESNLVNTEGQVSVTLTMNMIAGKDSILEKRLVDADQNETMDEKSGDKAARIDPDIPSNIKFTAFHAASKPAKLIAADQALDKLNQIYSNFDLEFENFLKEKLINQENPYNFKIEELKTYAEPVMSRPRQHSGGGMNRPPMGQPNFNGPPNFGGLPNFGGHMSNRPGGTQNFQPSSGGLGIGAFPHANLGQYKVNAYVGNHHNNIKTGYRRRNY